MVPGTSGKFPPHLHYGMYKDNGYTEWSFDPYPYLKQWERQERMKKDEAFCPIFFMIDGFSLLHERYPLNHSYTDHHVHFNCFHYLTGI